MYLAFSSRDGQWPYLGALDVDLTRGLSPEKVVVKNSDGWVLSVEFFGLGTGIETTIVTHYLVRRSGLQMVVSYQAESPIRSGKCVWM